MEEEKHQEVTLTDTVFTDKSDICQQLLDRYGKSSAPQHRHLCATAAATRSIIESESLPFTPLSYFAATIDAVSDTSKSLDSNAVSALSSFLAIVLPLVPEKSIAPAKAAEAVAVLVELVERSNEAVPTASVRALVKCLGVLVGFCDLEDWESLKLGFKTLLTFSTDKRPKVRKCSQDCVVKVFKYFESSIVIKKASKLVYSLLKIHMFLAVKISASGAVDGSKDGILSKAEHLEVIHFLNVLKHIVPYISVKISLKVLRELQKLLSSQFSALTRHVFDIIEVTFETSRAVVIIPEIENIMKSIASYISLEKKNPMDTVLSGVTLLKSALDKLHVGDVSNWISHLSLVIRSVAGLLISEASTASQASNILKELINHHIGGRNILINENQPTDDEAVAIKSTCAVLDDVLSTCGGGIPNEHILSVVSVLFLNLGGNSYFYMRGVVVKLADLMAVATCDTPDTKYLQECIGSAIIAMGPDKLFSLLPISFNVEDLTCSNKWLLPMLKNYVVGSSLQFFMEHVVPLAESFQLARLRVKKSVIGQDLQAHAHSCWGLLPAFCRFPTDTYESFGPLAKLLIPLLKKDSFMLEDIAIALQELVNQNRNVLWSKEGAGEFAAELPKTVEVIYSDIDFKSKPSYSKKTASRNIRALSSCSEELLQALIDVLFESPPEKRGYLKDAIRCLASITDSSVTKKIFISSLRRFELLDDFGECGKLGVDTELSIDKKQSDSTFTGKDAWRGLILELAASIVEGASKDLIDLIFSFIRHSLQETGEIGLPEAYHALSRILEEYSWFISSHLVNLVDLLLGLKSPSDIIALRSRFACFQTLLVHTLKGSLDEENTKAFLILNEIILALKESKEDSRKAAYDTLLLISSSLQESSCATSDGPYQKLVSMILGYLSGSSPHIKSGAVSALSILVYKDADVCLLMSDLVPSVVALLRSKAIEVIKAVLGFAKVLVLSVQAKDLQKLLPSIVDGILPWSSISRHHFRSKVIVILEIMMRKCGSAAVKFLVPEKYKEFVRSVLENRHGRTSSKEAGTIEVEPKLSDSSHKGHQKRKREDWGMISPTGEKSMESRRKMENKRKHIDPNTSEPRKCAGDKVVKEIRHSAHDKLAKGQSQGRRNKRRTFDHHLSAGKRKMEWGKVNKKNEANGQRPAAASKLSRHKRGVGKQQQKT